jgi:WhiB family redox-sensing transcriptional regulator
MTDWRTRARCLGADPELFFPERGASTRVAKAICGTCPVQTECLAYGTDPETYPSHGIWGGMAERHRRTLKFDNRTLVR